ncbi:MAG TPA: aldose 1-epimerase family protein [Flavobacterium sp.]
MNLIIQNNTLTARFSSKGAELQSLKNNNREFIWEGKPSVWGKHAPVLFPIVGTLKNNQFEYNNKLYELPRHGFARDMEFKVTDHTDSSITFLLESTAGTLEVYPFHFKLYVIYIIENNSLSIQYKVFNENAVPMYFSIGAHPAFALPQHFEVYEIEFGHENPEYHLLDQNLLSYKTKHLLLHNKRIQLDYDLFKDDALVFLSIPSKTVTIIENSNPLLKVHFDDFPDLGIWTKSNAPFICIEPWFGFADHTTASGLLKDKKGILTLNKYSSFESKFIIEILNQPDNVNN